MPQAASAQPFGWPLRVLLVEDDPGDARLVHELLRESEAPLRFEVETARTLTDALARLERGVFDVILTDLNLPESIGLDTLQAIRRGAPGQPVVVLTGAHDQSLSRVALTLGAQDFLVKNGLLPGTVQWGVWSAVQRHRYVRTLEANEHRLRKILQESGDATLVVDAEGSVRFANPASVRLFQRSASKLVGCPFGHPITGQKPAEIELRLADGTQRVAEMLAAPVSWEGDGAHVVTLRDVTERKRTERDLVQSRDHLRRENLALEGEVLHDRLTHVLNRRGLERALQVELHRVRRGRHPSIVALLDCDSFKSVNDEHGYVAGDAVLVEIARRIRVAVRPSDLVARIGGDEFMIVLTDTPMAVAMSVADRIRETVSREPVASGKVSVNPTVSIGLGVLPETAVSVASLLSRTEKALRSSKRGGRNRTSLAVDADAAGSAHVEAMLGCLRRPGAIRTLVQPVLRLPDGPVAGLEAISRFPSVPGEFPSMAFRFALEPGQQAKVDLACLRAGLGVLAAGRRHGRLHLNLNLLPSTLLGREAEVMGELKKANALESVCLEFPEPACVEHLEALAESVARLRLEGVQVVLDDYGMGKQSLETLVLLKPDRVKLPMRVIANIENSPDRQRSVRRLVQVAASVGTVVGAVGIERHAQAETLHELGVRYGQGYRWGEPADAEGYEDRPARTVSQD